MHAAFKTALTTAIVAAIATSQQARASQTYTGEGGLPLNPTANAIAPGTIEVQGNLFKLGDETGSQNGFDNPSPPPVIIGDVIAAALPQSSPLADYSFKYYGLHAAGILRNRLEISGGISRLQVSGDGAFNDLTRTGIALGLKYLVNATAAPGKVHFAIGTGYDRALLRNWRVYGVASKAFGYKEGRAPIVGHLGVRWDRFDLKDVSGPRSSKVSLYGGVEVPLTRTGELALIGELQTKNSEFSDAKIPYSVGLRYRPESSGFTLAAGLQRQGIIDDNGYYAQLGYDFD
jgi:hypothetical protein